MIAVKSRQLSVVDDYTPTDATEEQGNVLQAQLLYTMSADKVGKIDPRSIVVSVNDGAIESQSGDIETDLGTVAYNTETGWLRISVQNLQALSMAFIPTRRALTLQLTTQVTQYIL